jgi:hypothetical protein
MFLLYIDRIFLLPFTNGYTNKKKISKNYCNVLIEKFYQCFYLYLLIF